MKTVILALIGLGFCVQARSESVTTTDGATYNNITAQRVDPDGLYLEYTLPGGGFGMSKVKFTRLSADQQKQFGYDADKARDYETKVAKANEDYRQQCIKWDETAKSQRAEQQAREDQQDKALNERIAALTQLKQAEAHLAQVAPNAAADGYGYGYSWGGDGIGLIAIPQIGRTPRARTDFAPVVTPVPFPEVNIPKTAQQHSHPMIHGTHPGL